MSLHARALESLVPLLRQLQSLALELPGLPQYLPYLYASRCTHAQWVARVDTREGQMGQQCEEERSLGA